MRNIGIAIIDDESLVRLGIKSSVAWEKYGYEIVGEADNGQTGLEMIREKHPDIVLLDVCMPVMNGIEVLKSLQKLKIQCKVIILSCHDDFCFVKEAMKNGAFDYLRKNEINSANILTVLEEVRHSLCKKQDEGQGGWDSYARHVCLHRLITGSSEPAERQLPVSQLHIREGNLCCIVFAVQNYQKVQARYGEGRSFPLEQSVINLTVEVLHQWTQELEVFLLQENRYVILLSSQNSVSSTQWEEKVCSLVHELHTVFQNYLNADTCYGVSSAVSKFSALPEAFEHARYSLHLHYFQPDRFLIKEMRKPDRTMSRPEVKECLGDINICVSQKQYTQIFSRFYAFIQWLQQHHRENLDVMGVQNFFSNMVRFLLLQEGKAPEETVEKLQACETVEEAQRFLEDFQKGLKTGEPALDQKNYLIREAADYIWQNLSRGDISLDEIADHLMISKSYLCRLFQKKLGVSVQHYIYRIRIEQAKEYLNDFRLKIYEVAELTGFNSSTHFNIVFKKIMRCTPAEYRNGLKQ